VRPAPAVCSGRVLRFVVAALPIQDTVLGVRRATSGSCAVLAMALWAIGCGRIDYDGSRTTGIDAAFDGGVPRDVDAGSAEDAEVRTSDAGPRDATITEHDAGAHDGGARDASARDAGSHDGDAGAAPDAGVACVPACSPVEYCVVRAECAGTGTCRPRPTPTTEMCPAIYAPVCGCDGTTYPNGCEAGVSGMTSAFTGTCEGGPAGT